VIIARTLELPPEASRLNQTHATQLVEVLGVKGEEHLGAGLGRRYLGVAGDALHDFGCPRGQRVTRLPARVQVYAACRPAITEVPKLQADAAYAVGLRQHRRARCGLIACAPCCRPVSSGLPPSGGIRDLSWLPAFSIFGLPRNPARHGLQSLDR
jgi:hypothetical protein